MQLVHSQLLNEFDFFYLTCFINMRWLHTHHQNTTTDNRLDPELHNASLDSFVKRGVLFSLTEI